MGALENSICSSDRQMLYVLTRPHLETWYVGEFRCNVLTGEKEDDSTRQNTYQFHKVYSFSEKNVSGYQYHKMTNRYILVNLWLNPEICSVVSWTVSWIKGVNLSFGEKGDLNLESANPVICRTLAHTVKWVHCPCSYTVLFLPLNGDWETSEVVGSGSRKWQPKMARKDFHWESM